MDDMGRDVASIWSGGGLIANALGLSVGGGVIVTVAWLLLKAVLRRERGAESSAGTAVGSFDQAMALIREQAELITTLRATADQAYRERNEAVSADGAMQVRIEMLTEQVEHLTEQMRQSNERIEQYNQRIASLEAIIKQIGGVPA